MQKITEFYTYHKDERLNKILPGTGEKFWLPYKFPELIEHSREKTLIGVSDEENVEALCRLGIVSTTFAIHCWTQEKLKIYFQLFEKARIKSFIYFASNNKLGKTKAKKIKETCFESGLPYAIIHCSQLYNQKGKCPKDWDIVDFLEQNPTVTQEQFIDQIISLIHR